MSSTTDRSEYRKKWYQDNKERVAAASAARYQENKEYYKSLNSKNSKIWREKPEVKERLLKIRRKRYQGHKAVINQIQTLYGCQNPACAWNGMFVPCDLDYHHFDPETKANQPSQMGTCSLQSIIKEINKCVVLCAICHRRHHAGLLKLTNEAVCLVEISGAGLTLRKRGNDEFAKFISMPDIDVSAGSLYSELSDQSLDAS